LHRPSTATLTGFPFYRQPKELSALKNGTSFSLRIIRGGHGVSPHPLLNQQIDAKYVDKHIKEEHYIPEACHAYIDGVLVSVSRGQLYVGYHYIKKLAYFYKTV
jgi:hypothetical protein